MRKKPENETFHVRKFSISHICSFFELFSSFSFLNVTGSLRFGEIETSVYFVNRMDQVTAEINFVKVALGSFEDFQDEDQRKAYLKSKLALITDETLRDQLKGYVRCSEDKLQDQLNELQRKENLLQEEKLKMMAPPAGNYLIEYEMNKLK